MNNSASHLPRFRRFWRFVLVTLLAAVGWVSVGSLHVWAQPAVAEEGFRPHLASGLDLSLIHDVALAAEGKLLVAGSLRGDAELPHTALVRLNPDGTYDVGFRPALDANWVGAVAALRSGKVLVIGSFQATNGAVTHTNLARLNADGSLDASFDAGRWSPASTMGAALVELADGRILVLGGSFPSGGTTEPSHTRLLADGAVDSSYNSASLRGRVNAWAPGLGDEIYLAGVFVPAYSTNSPVSVVRVRGDGTLDPAFQPPAIWLSDWAMAPDGVGGVYVHGIVGGAVAGEVALQVLRLRRDGSQDAEFKASLKGRPAEVLPDGGVVNPPVIEAMVRQWDGRLLVIGKFETANGVARRNLARFEPDGSLDRTFDPGAGPRHSLDTFSYLSAGVVLAPDGRVYVHGRFDRYAGRESVGLVRLEGDPLPRMKIGRGVTGEQRVDWVGEPGTVVELETSADLRTWVPWITITNETGMAGAPFSPGGLGFVRGRVR